MNAPTRNDSKQRLFIGIPILNRLDLLARCLAAIDCPAEIVVVNNNATSPEFARSLDALAAERRFHVLHQKRNLGVATSWNLLLRTGFDRGYERVFIGSNDTFLHPGSLRRAVDFVGDSELGLGQIQAFDFFFVPQATTARIGWFDENFYPAYKEDQDFAYRCRLAGLKVAQVPDASAETIGSATIKSDERYQLANARTFAHWIIRYYVSKWGGDSGSERFTCPFNDQSRSLDYWPDPSDAHRCWDWDRQDALQGSSGLGSPGFRESSLLSGVILARNEEKNLAACMTALAPHVCEIIVIDMESTDATVEIANAHGARVLTHPRVPNFDVARNRAVEIARRDWMWFVDADERIPPGTGQVVNQLIESQGNDFEAMWIPFKNYFCKQWMQHCGWWPGYTMPRVLKRGHFQFVERLHGGVDVQGRNMHLPPDPNLAVDHFSYENIEHYLEKFNRYTSTEGLNLRGQGHAFAWEDGIREMVRDLWMYYERNNGIADGELGWVLSWLSGQYRWVSRAKLLDHHSQVPVPRGASVPRSLDDVFALMQRELRTLRTHTPRPPFGLVWRSPIFDVTGYATESRAALRALTLDNIPLRVEELPWNPSSADVAPEEQALLRALCRAEPPAQHITVIACIPSLCRPDPCAVANVLRAAFETDQIPQSWLPVIDQFDEVWVWSEANRASFRRGWVPPEKLRVVPGCIDTDRFTPKGTRRPRYDEQQGRFLFLAVLDWHLRKGWDLVLKAFCQEFGGDENAALLLKITRHHGIDEGAVHREADQVLGEIGSSLNGRREIVLAFDTLAEGEMPALYRSADAFVLPSRGEGWGRPYLEAMACGLPTIGTRGPGNCQFMTEANSVLVDSVEVDVPERAAQEIPPFRGHRWHEPNLDDLRLAMRRVFQDVGLRRRIGARGRRDVCRHFDLAAGRGALKAALQGVEERFLPISVKPPLDTQVRVAIEGEILAEHSFSLLNERLTESFAAHDRLAVRVHRVERAPTHAPRTTSERTAWAASRESFSSPPDITIKHAFPPNWNKPSSGKWVHIQYWEFGALPLDWIKPLTTDVDEIWVPARYVQRVYENSGIPAKKIRLIPYGVDPEIFRSDVPPLALPTPKTFRFLFVGGTIPRKGFDLLLDAYAAEFGPADDVCLVVKDIGAGSFYGIENLSARAKAMAADRSGPELLYYDHFLTDGQLASLYAACDSFVAPYRGEGFGLPILEAMACGLAPIVTSGGPSDDYVAESTGYLLQSCVTPCQLPMPTAGQATELLVDVAALRATLRNAYEQRTETAEKGRLASELVRTQWTWTSTIQNMTSRILALSQPRLKGKRKRSVQPSEATLGPVEHAQPVLAAPRLSLCMIVRDNERTIRRCLESIRPWVDEMIVVDTGSTDRTPLIAAEVGAKVHHFAWCDDFAAARNESLRHATGDWIFWMDSDDEIAPEHGQRLRECIRGATPNGPLGYVCQVRCPGPGARGEIDVTVVDHVKLFRNFPGVCFEGRIHEQVLQSIRARGGTVAFTDIAVVHAGYDHSAEGQLRKITRDLKLLHLELRDRPEHPFTLFNLGMTYANIGDHDQAAEYLRRSIAHSGANDSHVPKAYALLIYSLKENNYVEEACALCKTAIGLFPDDPELLFRCGVLLQSVGRLPEAALAFESTLACAGPRQFRSIDQGILGFKTRHNLALVLLEMGRFQEAELQIRSVIADAPHFHPAYRGLADLLLRQNRLEETEQLARQLDAEGIGLEAKLIRAELGLRTNRIEQACVDLVSCVEALPDDLDPLKRLARITFETGQLVEAKKWLKRVVELDGKDASALHNLGTIELQHQDFQSSIDYFQASLKLRPKSAQTLLYLGYALQGMGRAEEAQDAAQQAWRIDPTHPEVRHALRTAIALESPNLSIQAKIE